MDGIVPSCPKNKLKSLEVELLPRKSKTRKLDLYALNDDDGQDDSNSSSDLEKSLKPRFYSANFNPFAEEQKLALADRLDCVEAAKSRKNVRAKLNTSQGFQKCESFVEDIGNPMDSRETEALGKDLLGAETQFGISESEFVQLCDEAEMDMVVEMESSMKETIDLKEIPKRQANVGNKSPVLLESKKSSTPKKSIIEQILFDFCSSPEPKQELEAIAKARENASPRFRFKNLPILTYSKYHKHLKRRKLVNEFVKPVESSIPSSPSPAEEDKMSVCSDLSLQEGCNELFPDEVQVDLNKTQKLCENLLNLSAYFTQKSEESISPPKSGEKKSQELYSTAKETVSIKGTQHSETSKSSKEDQLESSKNVSMRGSQHAEHSKSSMEDLCSEWSRSPKHSIYLQNSKHDSLKASQHSEQSVSSKQGEWSESQKYSLDCKQSVSSKRDQCSDRNQIRKHCMPLESSKHVSLKGSQHAEQSVSSIKDLCSDRSKSPKDYQPSTSLQSPNHDSFKGFKHSEQSVSSMQDLCSDWYQSPKHSQSSMHLENSKHSQNPKQFQCSPKSKGFKKSQNIKQNESSKQSQDSEQSQNSKPSQSSKQYQPSLSTKQDRNSKLPQDLQLSQSSKPSQNSNQSQNSKQSQDSKPPQTSKQLRSSKLPQNLQSSQSSKQSQASLTSKQPQNSNQSQDPKHSLHSNPPQSTKQLRSSKLPQNSQSSQRCKQSQPSLTSKLSQNSKQSQDSKPCQSSKLSQNSRQTRNSKRSQSCNQQHSKRRQRSERSKRFIAPSWVALSKEFVPDYPAFLRENLNEKQIFKWSSVEDFFGFDNEKPIDLDATLEDNEADKTIVNINFETKSTVENSSSKNTSFEEDISMKSKTPSLVNDDAEDRRKEMELFLENDWHQDNEIFAVIKTQDLIKDSLDVKEGGGSADTETKFEGFKTASKKSIPISEKALKKAAKLIEAIDKEEALEQGGDRSIPSSLQRKSSKDFKDSECKVTFPVSTKPYKEDIFHQDEEWNTDCDFLADIKTQEMLQTKEDKPKPNLASRKEGEFMGFMTASKKTIIISDEALEKANKLLEELPDLEERKLQSVNPKEKQKSFKTNCIEPEEPSMQKVKSKLTSGKANIKSNKFLDTIQNLEANTKVPVRLQEISLEDQKNKGSLNLRGSIEPSRENFPNQELSIAEEKPNPNLEFSHNTPSNLTNKPQVETLPVSQKEVEELYLDFLTASMKKIPISKKAKEKVASMLREILEKDSESEANQEDAQENENVEEDFKHLGREYETFKDSKSYSLKKEYDVQAPKPSSHQCKEKVPTSQKELLRISKDPNISTESFEESDLKVDKDFFKIIASPKVSKKYDPLGSPATVACKEFENIQLSEWPLTLHQEANRISSPEIKNQLKVTLPFEGFQTASRKSIQISEEAQRRAANILKDLPDLKGEETEKASNEIDPFHGKAQYDLNDNFKGFASSCRNKESYLSNKSKEEPMKLSSIGFDHHHELINLSSDELERKMINILQDFENSTSKDLEKTSNNFDFKESMASESGLEGFKTASRKPINISEEALKKAANLLQDLTPLGEEESHQNESVPNEPINEKPSDITKERSKYQFKSVPTEANAHNHASKEELMFEGFRTASRKEIRISEDALKKANKLLEDLPSLGNDEEPSGSKRESTILHSHVTKGEVTFEGFKTASRKEIRISEESLRKANKLLEDLPPLGNDEEPSASKKDSNGSHLKSVPKTANPLNHYTKEEVISEGFKKSSRKESSNTIIERSKHQLKSVPTEANAHNHVSKEEVIFEGFKTASRKEIRISEEALRKANKLLSDLPPLDNDEVPSGSRRESASLHSDVTKEEVIFEGFQTASRKEIRISAEALRKANKLLEDLPPLGNDEEPSGSKRESTSLHTLATKEEVIFEGFQTASRKVIQVSEKAQMKAAKLLQDLRSLEIEIALGDNDKDTKFEDLKTASRESTRKTEGAQVKSVEPSHNSKTKPSEVNFLQCESKGTSLPFEDKRKEEIKFAALETTYRPTIRISEEANRLQSVSKASISIDKSINSSFPSNPEAVFTGFRTASCKAIQISEEAAKKAAKILQDLPCLDVNDDPKQPDVKASKLGKKSSNSNKESYPLNENKNLSIKHNFPFQEAEEEEDDLPISCSQMKVQDEMESNRYLPSKRFRDVDDETDLPEAKSPCPSFMRSHGDKRKTISVGGKVKSSLTDLATKSPLAHLTTSSIISRKNLLSLSKKNKNRKKSEGDDVADPSGRESPKPYPKIPFITEDGTTPKALLKDGRYLKPSATNTPNSIQKGFKPLTEDTSTPKGGGKRFIKDPQIKEVHSFSLENDFQKIKWDNCNANNCSSSKTNETLNKNLSEKTEPLPPPSPQERIERLSIYADPPAISPIPTLLRSNCRPSGLRRSRASLPLNTKPSR